ncbi:MAG: hypothetical protein ACK4ZN_10675 [Oceanibaculum sp.]
MSFSRLLLCLLALTLAACQPLPQPFQPADKDRAANPLLEIPGGEGVMVLPVVGTAPEAGQEAAIALARAIARALNDQGLPASTTGNAASLILRGEADLQERTDSRDRVRVAWTLFDAAGREMQRHESLWWVNRPHWERGTPETLAGMAAEAAPALARAIQGEPIRQVPVVDRLYIWSVDGAPGDGNVALKRMVEASLKERGLRIAGAMEEDALVLLGSVAIDPLPGKPQERVTVRWSVIRLDGREIGTVEQSNPVPAGALNGSWGQVAYLVAEAAADGIVQLVRESARR